jgi:hypothetical protein
MTDDIFYIPGIVKMAETQIEHCSGAKLRKLRALIAAAKQADDNMMSYRASVENPAWVAAYDVALGAACALRDFANSL